MPATMALIRDSMAASGAIALATRGHCGKLGSAADACATAPHADAANAAAALTLVRSEATLPMELLSCLPALRHPASELIFDSKQEGAPECVVFQRGAKRTARRQGRDLHCPVRRIVQVVDLEQERQSLQPPVWEFVPSLQVQGPFDLDLSVAKLVEIANDLAREWRAVRFRDPHRSAVLFIVQRERAHFL